MKHVKFITLSDSIGKLHFKMGHSLIISFVYETEK